MTENDVRKSKNSSKPNQKVKEEQIEVEGVVLEAVRGKFVVEIKSAVPNAQKHMVTACIAGKIRKNFIKIVPGDTVKLEISPYDISNGRITYRVK